MPTPVLHPTTRPSGLFATLRQHAFLVSQLTRREVTGRYRGSYLGIVWSFINPLLLLCIYTLVFHYIFNARGGSPRWSSSTCLPSAWVARRRSSNSTPTT